MMISIKVRYELGSVATRNDVLSEASLESSHKNVSMSLNSIMYLSSFASVLTLLISANVIMYLCPIVSELRFYRCYYPVNILQEELKLQIQ